MAGEAKIELLADLCRVDGEVLRMVAIVCDAHDAKNPEDLYDRFPDAFDDLVEAAESMFEQLGGD